MKKFVFFFASLVFFGCDGVDEDDTLDCFGSKKSSYMSSSLDCPYVSARSLYSSSSYDGLKFNLSFDSYKTPTLKCFKEVDSKSIPYIGNTIKNLAQKGDKCYFILDSRYFKLPDGQKFLRLPIYGHLSLCSVVSTGIDPEAVYYLKPFFDRGMRANDPIWQKIADDFSLNIHVLGAYQGTKIQTWYCANQGAKDLIDIYHCSANDDLYGTNGHATTLIPLDDNFRVKGEYIMLLKRVTHLNFVHGGHFGT